MEKSSKDKKATTPENVVAGTTIKSSWLNQVTADLTKMINAACS